VALASASLEKCGYVLELAKEDHEFRQSLGDDPYRTLAQNGIDLSSNEIMALVDIVKNTSLSTIAPLLNKMRREWEAMQ